MKTLILGLTLVASIYGCSSQIIHSEISTNLPPGSAVDGVPYRTPKRFKAVIYEKTDKGYSRLTSLPVTIPDPDRIYVLGFRSEPFSSATLDLQVNTDNTLQQVSLKSASTAAAAITAAGTQVTAINTAEQARIKSASDAETNAAKAAVAADKAKQAADLAALQYEALLAKTTASAEEVLKAANAARSAKLDANEAARLAGKPPYFPDVVP